MKRIAVMISNKGQGSNLQALIKACKDKKIKGEIVVVVSDKIKAYGLKRAKKNKIPVLVKPFSRFNDSKARTTYGKKLARKLKEKYKVDLVVLAGWMIVLPLSFLKHFPYRVINLHPGLIADKKNGQLRLSDGSLAKSFKGKMANQAIQAVFKEGVSISGSSTHFVTNYVDWGPVIMRIEEGLREHDTAELYYSRLKEKEHLVLFQSVKLFCENKLKIENNLVKITDKRYKKDKK